MGLTEAEAALAAASLAGVHKRAAGGLLEKRRIVLEQAYAMHPERLVRGVPSPLRPAAEVWPEDRAIRRTIQLQRGTDFVTQGSQSH